MSQQKDNDPEEYKRLHSEREAHLKRIQQLVEETSRLKAEASRLKEFSTFIGCTKVSLEKKHLFILVLAILCMSLFSCSLQEQWLFDYDAVSGAEPKGELGEGDGGEGQPEERPGGQKSGHPGETKNHHTS